MRIRLGLLSSAAAVPTTEKIGEFVFDQNSGHGEVPLNREVDYRGFVVYLKPVEFLSLVPPSANRDLSELEQSMRTHGVASPWLELQAVGDHHRVVGHEGRHRCLVLKQVQPNERVPVHVFEQGKRARHFDHADVKNIFTDIIPENKRQPIQIVVHKWRLRGEIVDTTNNRLHAV